MMAYDEWEKAFPAAVTIYKYAMYDGNRVDFADVVHANIGAAKDALQRIHECNMSYMAEMEELLAKRDYTELRHHIGHVEQGLRAAFAIAGLIRQAERDVR